MKTRHALFAGLVALAMVPACASEEEATIDSIETDQEELATDDGKADAISNSTYYTVRRDYRRCLAPLCGGYFVKRVNQLWTPCPGMPGGKTDGECYVAAAVGDMGDLTKGRVMSKNYGDFGNLREFRTSEAWYAQGDVAASGIFYRVNTSGIVCITYPCPTHKETKLNSSVAPKTIAGADLSGANAPQSSVDSAFTQMSLPSGVLVAGVNTTVTGPAGSATALKATQFYLRKPPQQPVTGCDAIRCAAGTHCELQEIVCITTPCNPIAQCVPDINPCSLVRCAAGTHCVANGTSAECVPDLTCASVLCAPGSVCVDTASGPKCQATTTPPPGGCNVDADCQLYDQYCSSNPCACEVLGHNQRPATCSASSQVQCFVQPCLGKVASCVNHACVINAQ